MKTTCVTLVIALIGSIECQFAPGVPPPAGADIKFHDPNEFRNSQQQDNIGQQATDSGDHHHHHEFGEELDKEHLDKHKRDKYVDTEKMSDRERLIYQFKNFDLDKDGRVDGHDVLKSIAAMGMDDGDIQTFSEETFNDLVKAADDALKMYDADEDGYVTFREFTIGMEAWKTKTGATWYFLLLIGNLQLFPS